MGDSLANFSDIGSLEYTGLSDTSDGFSGSSTLQDVQLGSPLLLDSSYGPNADTSVIDLMPLGSGGLDVSGVTYSQSLSGISDTPIGSASLSTPTPNVTQPNAAAGTALTALSKFGASIASLWSGPSVTRAGAQPVYATPAQAPLIGGAASGTNVVILLIVVGALVFLLARAE